jgi:hypothetical protein
MSQDPAKPTPSDARPSTLAIAALGSTAAIVGWSEAGEVQNRRGFRLVLDGQIVPPPAAHCTVAHAGARRHLLAVPIRTAQLMQGRIQIVANDGVTVAQGDRTGLTAPRTTEFDVLSLVPELAPRETIRLARFLLEIAPSLLRLGRDAAFVAFARSLVETLSDGIEPMAPRCCAGPLAFFETAAHRGVGERSIAVLVAHDAVARVAQAPASLTHPKPQRGLTRIAIAVERTQIAPESLLVVIGEGGVACRRLPSIEPSQSAFASAQRDATIDLPLRDYIVDSLLALDDPARPTAALARELRAATAGLKTPAPTGALTGGIDLALPTVAGTLVLGWLVDPHAIADAIVVRRRGHEDRFPVAQLARLRHPLADRERTTRSGFVLVAPPIAETSPLASVQVRLQLGSGEILELGHGPSRIEPDEALRITLDALATVAQSGAVMPAPLREILHVLARGAVPTPEFDSLAIGSRIADPELAVIVPASADAELLRCRFTALALEPRFASRAEIVHAVADPAAGETVAEALRQIELVCGHGTRLVAANRRTSSAAAINAAIASTQAPLVIILGSQAMPAASGWAARLQREFDANPRAGLIAARRVAEDGALVDLGFDRETDVDGRTRFLPRLAGFPAANAEARVAAKVAGCARGAWILRRSFFELLGGLADDMLSDLGTDLDFCSRVRASGFELRQLADADMLEIPASPPAARDDLSLRIDQIALLERWPFRPVDTEPTPLPGTEAATPVAINATPLADTADTEPVVRETTTKAKGKGGKRIARKSRSAA